MDLNNCGVREPGGRIRPLTVSGTHFPMTRSGLAAFAGKRIPRIGRLELTSHPVQRIPHGPYEFGQIRVVEIPG